MNHPRISSGAALLLLFAALPLRAEPLPEGTRTAKRATEGATDVAGAGFQGAETAEDKDAAQLEIAAGGLVAAGNSRQLVPRVRISRRRRPGIARAASSATTTT